MSDEFEVERDNGNVVLRMEPYVARSLAGALRELNRYLIADGMNPDSGWSDIAAGLLDALAALAEEEEEE